MASSNNLLQGPVHRPKGTIEQILIFLHGYGADGMDLFGLAPLFAEDFPQALILSPDAPFPCEMGFGRQWFGLQNLDLDDKGPAARQAADSVISLIESLRADHDLPPSKIGLLGFSQGTMVGLEAALHLPAAIGGIVGFSGAFLSGTTLPDTITARPPVLLIHGTADPIVPFAALHASETALKTQDVPVETLTRPGLQHGIDEAGLFAAKRFFRHHLL